MTKKLPVTSFCPHAYRRMGKLDLADQAAKKSEEASREQSNQALQHVREVVAEQDAK